MCYEAKYCHYELYIRREVDKAKNKFGSINLEQTMNTINLLFSDIIWTAGDM
jgi:hypothetical protein